MGRKTLIGLLTAGVVAWAIAGVHSYKEYRSVFGKNNVPPISAVPTTPKPIKGPNITITGWYWDGKSENPIPYQTNVPSLRIGMENSFPFDYSGLREGAYSVTTPNTGTNLIQFEICSPLVRVLKNPNERSSRLNLVRTNVKGKIFLRPASEEFKGMVEELEKSQKQ